MMWSRGRNLSLDETDDVCDSFMFLLILNVVPEIDDVLFAGLILHRGCRGHCGGREGVVLGGVWLGYYGHT